jgi:thiamine pyrophosphate-dependent acetolactate synthase large subunit-like protein
LLLFRAALAAEEGVDLVYGYQGAIMPVYDEYINLKTNCITCFGARHEQVRHMLLKDLQSTGK